MESGGTFSERLRAARKASGLRQEEVAKRAGMSQGAYSELERGKSKSSRRPGLLAKVLNVDPLWLETGVEQSHDSTQHLLTYNKLSPKDKEYIRNLARRLADED